VRLFLAGGPVGEDATPCSSAPIEAGALPGGPDMGKDIDKEPDARALSRELGDKVAGSTVESDLLACCSESEIKLRYLGSCRCGQRG